MAMLDYQRVYQLAFTSLAKPFLMRRLLLQGRRAHVAESPADTMDVTRHTQILRPTGDGRMET